MTHVSDDDLILHYYGDPACPPDTAAHLDACASCAGRYAELSAALSLLPVSEVPARGEHYGLEVWQRVRPHLAEGDVRPTLLAGRPLAVLAAAAALVLAAAVSFVALRPRSAADPGARAAALTDAAARDDESRRVLLSAVADHLERSDRVLTEIMNAPADSDISTQQEWAEDLIWAGRLYRQSALESDERSVVAVLDEVERTLLDIVHTPAGRGDEKLDDVRRRVESAALLFKVRVMRDELHQQQLGAARPGGTSPVLSEVS